MFEINTTTVNANITIDINNNDSQKLLSNTIIYSFLALNGLSLGIGLVGNIAIIIQNAFSDRFHSRANYFITCLAGSGIQVLVFNGTITVLGNLVWFEWIVGTRICSFAGFIQTVSELLNAFTLVASNMDRYFAILRPFRHQPSSTTVFAMMAGIWTISFMIPVPMAYFSHVLNFNDTTLCLKLWPESGYRHLFIKTCIALNYVLPLIVMMITCSHVSVILDKKPPGEACQQMISRRSYAKKKTIRVFLLTFGTYYICWLPKHIIEVMGEEYPSIYNAKFVCVFWLAAQWLALSHPAITAVVIHATRSTFSTCLTKLVCTSSERAEHESFQRERKMTNEFNLS